LLDDVSLILYQMPFIVPLSLGYMSFVSKERASKFAADDESLDARLHVVDVLSPPSTFSSLLLRNASLDIEQHVPFFFSYEPELGFDHGSYLKKFLIWIEVTSQLGKSNHIIIDYKNVKLLKQAIVGTKLTKISPSKSFWSWWRAGFIILILEICRAM